MNTWSEKVRARALDSVSRWAEWADRYWFDLPDQPGLGGWGTGYDAWGVQTNQKYLAAMAILATEAGGPFGPYSAEQARERATAALRFALASHKTGELACTDGRQWGRTWISILGIERMMPAVEVLEPSLTDEDQEALKRVLTDEADFQRTETIYAGLWGSGGHNNRPESNIWNGALCARVAMMYPDDPRVAEWLTRAHLYLLNGISLPADAQDAKLIDGKPLSEWHVGPNFFPNFALDHHAYMNLGYMAICLSNVALLHYSYRFRNETPLTSLYHHARELWDVVKRMVAPDGRLLRVGGDTRQRYCYCQDYLLPALVLAADEWADPHAAQLLEGVVDMLCADQNESDDGSYLHYRLGAMEGRSPYYYSRLESDKALVLALAAQWLGRLEMGPDPAAQPFEESVAGGWCEPEHGAVLHRCPTRYASWSWRAANRPQGLCLPPDCSSMAEWEYNLAGWCEPIGEYHGRELVQGTVEPMDGGFLAVGETRDGVKVSLAEGWQAEETARHALAVAALPDGHTMLHLEQVRLPQWRVYLKQLLGFKLEIPNDHWNRHHRRVASASGAVDLQSYQGPEELLNLESSWVCIDDRIGLLGVYGADGWSIWRRGRRFGGKHFPSVLAESLCWHADLELHDHWGPGLVLDNGAAILASVDAETTRSLDAQQACSRAVCLEEGRPSPYVRALRMQALDGRTYLFVANLGPQDAEVTVQVPGRWIDLVRGETNDVHEHLGLLLEPLSSRLLRLE